MEKEDNVIVRVTDPQTDASKNFVTYMIAGSDDLGTFQIRRRFNDFFFLRQALKKKWPGLYIPPIPEKKMTITGGKDEQQIEYRRKFFQYFLKQLGTYRHLFYCTVTQQFLRNKSIEMEKYFQTISSPKSAQLIQEYKKSFPNIDYKKDSVQNRTYCSNFTAYLKKAEKQLKVLGGEMNAVVEARNNFLENLNACNTTILPEYEKNVYSEYISEDKKDPILLFVNQHKVQDNIRNLRDNSIGKPNPFTQFYDMLVYQARQIEAFQQAVNGKETLQSNKKKLQEKCLSSQAEVSKLMGGKFSIKSIFSKGSKNDQIQLMEKEIPEMQKEIECLGQLCEIVNCIQGSVQIPKFKLAKQKQYYSNLSTTSEQELDFLASYGQFMKSVMVGLGKSLKV